MISVRNASDVSEIKSQIMSRPSEGPPASITKEDYQRTFASIRNQLQNSKTFDISALNQVKPYSTFKRSSTSQYAGDRLVLRRCSEFRKKPLFLGGVDPSKFIDHVRQKEVKPFIQVYM